MNRWSKGWIVAVFCGGLVVGTGIGLLRPNQITFLIRANKKVNLLPRPGDVINWVTESSKGTVKAQVTFEDTGDIGVPCKEIVDSSSHTIDSCTVTATPTVYLYGCKTNAGKPCFDPAVGPHGGGGDGFFGMLKFVLRLIHEKILEVFHLWPQAQQFTGNAVNLDQPGVPHSPLIRCAGNKTAVSPITAYPSENDSIEWRSKTELYHFRMPDSVCAELDPNFNSSDRNATCTPTLAKPGAYTYVVHFDSPGGCPDFTANLCIQGPGVTCAP
jgi:hypothetical protein